MRRGAIGQAERALAALAAAALAVMAALAGSAPVALASAAPVAATSTPALAPASASASTTAGAPATEPSASYVACPRAKVTTPASAKKSPMPTHPDNLPVFGGDTLAEQGLSVPGGSPKLPDNVSATSWIVADAGTGEVLSACSPHDPGAPASIQKLLLSLTVLPKLDPEQVVTVTKQDMDFEAGSSAVGLVQGGKYTVETLWLGLLLQSGNDAANVLARVGGGGGEDGVTNTLRDMNATARQIGALDTHAETPHGLDGPGQATTAYDMALIMRELLKRDDFRRYDGAKTAKIPAQPQTDPPRSGFQIQNQNRLLFEYEGGLGGKTGFTDIARHTFVGAATRGGRTLVVVLLGAEQRPVRTYQQAAGLLDWGFALGYGRSVGHLVTPDEAQQLVAEAYASERAEAQRLADERMEAMRQSAQPTGAGSGPAAWVVTALAGAGVAAVLLTTWLVVLFGIRALRRRTPPA